MISLKNIRIHQSLIMVCMMKFFSIISILIPLCTYASHINSYHNLTTLERSSIACYQNLEICKKPEFSYDQPHKIINNFLRFGYLTKYKYKDQILSNIHQLDSAISKSTRSKRLSLYRGVDLEYRSNKPFLIGEEFIDKGFVSTSTNMNIAKVFSGQKMTLFKIYSPIDFKGFYYNITQEDMYNHEVEEQLYVEEEEVLLPRESRFKVMSKTCEYVDYKCIYTLQLCPTSGCLN